MLLSTVVEVTWNSFTRKWYEDKGYTFTQIGDKFLCRIEDLQVTSTAKVEVMCDICSRKHQKEYRKYLKGRAKVQIDCCGDKKCLAQKTKHILMQEHGVTNVCFLPGMSEKKSQMFRTPYEDVIKLCHAKGLILLSSSVDYKNDRSRLLIICSKHKELGIQETCFANIKANKGCCGGQRFELVAESRKEDGQTVFNMFKEKGLIPCFKPSEYKNLREPLPYMCEEHLDKGIQYRAYGHVKEMRVGDGCPYCARERSSKKKRLGEDEVWKLFQEKGLMVLEGEEYKGKDIPIQYVCIKHPEYIQHVSYGGLKVTKCPCDYCRMEESLSELNRRFRSSIKVWKDESVAACGGKCILTGSTTYEIHHVYPYKAIIKEALDNTNIKVKEKIEDYSGEELSRVRDEVIRLHELYPYGVCLKPELHRRFHKEYGKNAGVVEFQRFVNDFIKNKS